MDKDETKKPWGKSQHHVEEDIAAGEQLSAGVPDDQLSFTHKERTMREQPVAYVTSKRRVGLYTIVIRRHAKLKTRAQMSDVANSNFTNLTAARLIAEAINQFDAGRK